MKKPFELIFFILVMLWVGLILLADGPQNRMEMVCKPVSLTGRMASAIASLGSASAEDQTRKFFVNRMQDCRQLVYKQFYEQEYNAMLESLSREERNIIEKMNRK